MERVFVLKNVRLFYKKMGNMKFVSHLDMNRFMARLIARTNLPVWFTEGFNQHIYLNFAVPLSLGFEGNYEILDIRLIDDEFPLEEIPNILNSVSVPDVQFFAAAEVKKQMKEIGFAEFKVELENLNETDIQKINKFFESDTVLCEKKTKKGGIKQINIMPNIKKAQISGNVLTLILTAGNEENLNPTLVLTALFEYLGQTLDYSVTRTMIYDKNMDKFA